MIRINFPTTEKAYIDEIVVRKEKTIIPDGESDTEYVNENNLAYKKAYTVDADVLYGVTMEEKGVSKIVSVKLTEAIKHVGD